MLSASRVQLITLNLLLWIAPFSLQGSTSPNPLPSIFKTKGNCAKYHTSLWIVLLLTFLHGARRIWVSEVLGNRKDTLINLSNSSSQCKLQESFITKYCFPLSARHWFTFSPPSSPVNQCSTFGNFSPYPWCQVSGSWEVLTVDEGSRDRIWNQEKEEKVRECAKSYPECVHECVCVCVRVRARECYWQSTSPASSWQSVKQKHDTTPRQHYSVELVWEVQLSAISKLCLWLLSVPIGTLKK